MNDRRLPDEAVSAGAAVLSPHVGEAAAPGLAVQVWRAIWLAISETSAGRGRGRPLNNPAAYEAALAEVRAGASPGSVRMKYGLSGSVTARLKKERDGA